MKIRVTALFVVALVSLSVAGVNASAAERPVCRLEPIAGSESFLSQRDSDGLDVMAMWMATVDCPGSPLDGLTVEIQQIMRLRSLGGGAVGGPTRILIDFTSAGLRAEFRGDVRGDLAISSSTAETTLEIRANGERGSKFHGHETLTIDRSTGEVVAFKPGDADTTSGK